MFPLLCLLKSPLLPSNSPRLTRLKPNGADVDKAKSDIKQISIDSNRFASISAPKVKLGPYDWSQQILVSITFILSKLCLLHICPTRGLTTRQTVLPSHLRPYKIEVLISAVKQLSLDTAIAMFFTDLLQVIILQLTVFTAQGAVTALGHTGQVLRSGTKVVLMTCNGKDQYLSMQLRTVGAVLRAAKLFLLPSSKSSALSQKVYKHDLLYQQEEFFLSPSTSDCCWERTAKTISSKKQNLMIVIFE